MSYRKRMITNSFSFRTLQLLFLSLCLLILSQQQQQNQSSLDYNFFTAVNGQTSSSHIATLAKCNADTITEADSNIQDGLIDVDEYQLLLFELAPSSCNILDAYNDKNVFLDKVWTVLTCVCKQFDDHYFGNTTGKSNDHFDGTNISAVSCCDAASPHFTIPGYFNEPAYSNEVCQILDRAISAECNRLDRQKILQKEEEKELLKQQQQQQSNEERTTEEYYSPELIRLVQKQKEEEKELLIQQQQQQQQSNEERTTGEYSSPELIRNFQNNSKDTSSSKQAKETSIQITGSPPKSIALAIAPKFAAFLSICGSLGIILKVLSKSSRRKNPMQRIMLGMSVSDVLVSIWYFVGTSAIPANTLSRFGNGTTEVIFWAVGDQRGISCIVAGFFNQFSVATVLYNNSLAVYYLLVVKNGWTNRRIAKIQWLFHLVPLGYAFVTSTFAAVADLYGEVEWTCWILPNELFDDTKDLTFFQSKFKWIQWIFLFGVVWMCIIVNIIIFVILYRTMKSMELRMTTYASYSTDNGNRIKDAKSTKMAAQSLLYVGAFFITWLFPTITRIADLTIGRTFFWIQFLDSSLVCLQGFLNFLIYIRPHLSNYRKKNPDSGFLYILKSVVTEN